MRAVLGPDPYSQVLLSAYDAAQNLAITLYRDQDRVTGATVVTPDGPIELSLDERLRITRIQGYGESIALDWADDSTSIAFTVATSSINETVTAAVDLSDDALLANVDFLESQYGLDATPLREWVADNPGLAQAILTGEQAPRSITGGSRSAFDPPEPLLDQYRDAVNTMNGLLALEVALTGATLALYLEAFGSSLLLTAGLGFAAGAALFVVALALAILILYLIDLYSEYCDPCTLSCFFKCAPIPDTGD